MADYRRLGQLIREARRARNVTQIELGEALGLSRESVSGIERGRPKKPLDPDHINKVATLLKIPVLSMVTALGYDVRVPGVEDEQQAVLLALFGAAPPWLKDSTIGGLRAGLESLGLEPG